MSEIQSHGTYTFAPSRKQVTLGVASFQIEKLQIIEHAPTGALLYATASPDIGYTAVSGSTVTLAYDTSGMNAADPLRIYYADDLFSVSNPGHVVLDAQGAGLATAARQDAGNATLAAISADLGSPLDTDPGSDTASGSVIALLKRGLGRWTTFLGRYPAALGPATAAGSIPVTLPADGQFAASVGLPADAAAASDAGAASLIALAKRGLGRWTTLLTNFGTPDDAPIQSSGASGTLMAQLKGILARQLVTQAGPGGSAPIASAIQGVFSGVPVPVSGTIAVNASTVTADTAGTLTANGTATLAANPMRQLFILTNTGANPLSYRFGSIGSALNGHALSPGDTVKFDGKVPTALVSIFSAGGTSYFATTG